MSHDVSATQPVLSRFEPSNRRRLSAPALRTFLAIADLWGLNEEQRRLMLGYPSRSTFHSWCKQAREHGSITLVVDVLTRISAVLGIHQALTVLFSEERDGIAWLRQPHEARVFGGRPPFMLATNGTQGQFAASWMRRAAAFICPPLRQRPISHPMRMMRSSFSDGDIRRRAEPKLSAHPLALSADRAVRLRQQRMRRLSWSLPVGPTTGLSLIDYIGCRMTDPIAASSWRHFYIPRPTACASTGRNWVHGFEGNRNGRR